jgi:beta-barrel assembly-enhancing protease
MNVGSPLNTCMTRLGRLASLVAAISLVCPHAPAQAQVNLPSLGDSVSEDLDVNTEARIGQRIMEEIRQDPSYLDDPVLTEYLQSVFDALVVAAKQRGDIDPARAERFGWQIFEVQESSVNAFALPGGFVGVHLGLIAMTSNVDELAAVLGHELSHITQRHIARSFAAQKHMSTATMAAMVLGILAASRAGNSSIDAANAVLMGTQAAMAQGQINFTREMEREADRFGMNVLIQAGFASSGMASMFEKLQAATNLNDNEQYPFLRDHPLTSERIAEARLRMNTAPSRRPPSLAEHSIIRARAQVLMNGSDQSLYRLEKQAAPGTPLIDENRLSALYGGAFAAMKLRHFDEAQRIAHSAMDLVNQHYANEPLAKTYVELLQLDIEMAMPKPPITLTAALAPLKDAHTRPAMLSRAQAALSWQRAGDPAAAAQVRDSLEELQTWVVEHKADTLAWRALSQCAAALGQRLRSLRADAEASASQGDIPGAIDRFRVAQNLVKEDPNVDYVEASIVQSRLRELEAERRRMKKEDQDGL